MRSKGIHDNADTITTDLELIYGIASDLELIVERRVVDIGGALVNDRGDG